MKKCETCDKSKGRTHFVKNKLDEKRKAPSYILVCEECVKREAEVLLCLRAPGALMCKCRQPLGHSDKCKVAPFGHSGYNKGVTLDDLRFLRFRPKHVVEYNIR